MFKKAGNIIILGLILVGFAMFQSCNKKDPGTIKSNDSQELIKTDNIGQKVDLKLKPKAGDIFRYKMVKSSKESASDKDKKEDKISQEQTETYYYSLEVNDVSESGVVTFKMKYDSINIIVKYSEKDTSVTAFTSSYDFVSPLTSSTSISAS